MISRPRGSSRGWGGGWSKSNIEPSIRRFPSPPPQVLLFVALLGVAFAGCVSDKVGDRGEIGAYQQTLADKGPQERVDTRGEDTSNPLGVLEPVSKPLEPPLGNVEIIEDPNTGKKLVRLTMEQAIVRTLANSPEIRVVSFDPAIAKTDITKAAASFDPVAFSRYDYEQDDNPRNSIFQPGRSDVRTAEAGVQQRVTTGAQWSFSYALTRSWDDLFGRTLSTRYEPLLVFQVKQPLWRDAWEQVNLAGVSVARLNYAVALSGFRQRAEEVSAQVIAAYWLLVQARRDLEIQRILLDQSITTLEKVRGRRGIDATAVQTKQAEASMKLREAFLVQAQKRMVDAQDALLGLMMAPDLNILTEIEIVPVTEPYLEAKELHTDELVAMAMENNPQVQQAHIAMKVADINVEVAENQYMPRLDLVASTRGTGIGEDRIEAHRSLEHDDFVSYAVGVVLEYPLGNRERAAELYKRRLERRKAISSLHSISDLIAVQVKEKMRKAQTNYAEIQVERQAAEAAEIQLQALQDTEEVREQLTPEFLLVKLQAQQDLAEARRSEARAIADYNIAIAELAQATGTVLELHRVQSALDKVIETDPAPESQEE